MAGVSPSAGVVVRHRNRLLLAQGMHARNHLLKRLFSRPANVPKGSSLTQVGFRDVVRRPKELSSGEKREGRNVDACQGFETTLPPDEALKQRRTNRALDGDATYKYTMLCHRKEPRPRDGEQLRGRPGR